MKKLLFVISFSLCEIFVCANQISFNTAQKIAEGFALTQGIDVNLYQPINVAPEQMFHQLYVFGFENSKGFVIVAADDRVLPILGYSLTTDFLSVGMPDHIKEWLSDYEAQIDSLVAHNVEPTAIVQREWDAYLDPMSSVMSSMSTVVGPLLTTTWNQDPYYNDLCPTLNSVKTYTGCTATATAQVMKYWNHPISGRSSHSYLWNNQTLSANFENTIYQWSNMPVALTSSSSSAQINAVATLMYHVGVALEMNYNGSSNGGSSAKAYSTNTNGLTVSAETVLQKYFKYKNDICDVRYADMTDAQWKTILKSELNDGRVVLYSGRRPDGGHTFVCDGYNSNNYFHFNWGWGAFYDGFYAIGNLNPTSTKTYNIKNVAVIGIQPITGNVPSSTIVTSVAADMTQGSVSGSGTYNAYDTITLLANANEGYLFGHWNDNDKSNPRYVFATSPTFNRTAYFVPLSTDTLHYCSDELHSSSGSNSMSPRTYNWGIRYPSFALEPYKVLTTVQFIPNEIGQYIVKLYQGDGSQMVLGYTQQFTASVTEKWIDIHLTTPYVIDATKSLWITLEYTGTGYPMSYSSYYGGNGDGMRRLVSGDWKSFPDYKGKYGSWCIKGITEENAAPIQYHTLTAKASPSNCGTVTPDSTYAMTGTAVLLTASANDNCRFVDWNDGVTDYNRILTISGEHSLIANFEYIEENDTVGYCVHDYVNGLGYANGNKIVWGIKFNSGSPLQNKLLKAISYYCGRNSTTMITAKIYKGGNAAPQTLVSQFSFTPAPSSGWQTYQLPAPVSCGNNVIWIMLSCEDGSYYPSSYTSYSANPNGSFVSLNGGSSYHSILDNGRDITWMLRAVTECEPVAVDVYDHVCEGEPYYGYGINGIVFHQDTIITIHSRTVVNLCDSTTNIHISLANPSYGVPKYETIHTGESYTWHGVRYNASGTYRDTSVNSIGCDSICTLHLTVKPYCQHLENYSICQGSVYVWHDRRISDEGTYYDTVQTSSDCDSVYELTLTTNTTYYKKERHTICQGDTYKWHNHNLSAAGVYYDSLLTSTGCDSVYELILIVYPTYMFEELYTICQGETYSWHNHVLTMSGTYYDSLSTSTGCDSVYKLALTVNPTYFFEDVESICQGEFFHWHGRALTESGIYCDSLITVAGCDSVYELTLTINPTYLVEDSAELSDDGSDYMWHGKSYTTAGDYVDSLSTVFDCDSICILHLANPIHSGVEETNRVIDVKIVPNPMKVGGTAYISANWTDEEIDGMTIEVITSTGDVVSRITPETQTTAIDGISLQGIYFIRITTGTDDVYVRKLIVK